MTAPIYQIGGTIQWHDQDTRQCMNEQIHRRSTLDRAESSSSLRLQICNPVLENFGIRKRSPARSREKTNLAIQSVLSHFDFELPRYRVEVSPSTIHCLSATYGPPA